MILKKVEEKWEESKKAESLPLILPVVEEADFHPQDKTRTRVSLKHINIIILVDVNGLLFKKIISKWWLLITLHNNPTLRAHRKHALLKEASNFEAYGHPYQEES